MSTIYQSLVKGMHQKFGISYEDLPNFTEEERIFRIAAMQEELDEYEASLERVDELDALVDLAVFLFGTVERMGLESVFEEAYRRVMASNLQKELGPNNKRGGFSLDLQKPADFKSADLTDLV
jgi:predicted HAD superfamily Cof-like phosphohydrolase